MRRDAESDDNIADDLVCERRESERRAMEARQEGDRGRIPDDNSFYERREFDDTRYRRRR